MGERVPHLYSMGQLSCFKKELHYLPNATTKPSHRCELSILVYQFVDHVTLFHWILKTCYCRNATLVKGFISTLFHWILFQRIEKTCQWMLEDMLQFHPLILQRQNSKLILQYGNQLLDIPNPKFNQYSPHQEFENLTRIFGSFNQLKILNTISQFNRLKDFSNLTQEIQLLALSPKIWFLTPNLEFWFLNTNPKLWLQILAIGFWFLILRGFQFWSILREIWFWPVLLKFWVQLVLF